MKTFMEPRSVALIGVSSRVGKGSLNILENLIQVGFPGRVYPVNPKIQELLGHKVFPDVRMVPDDIDLAVIMTPRQIVPSVLRQCTEKEIDSVLIITQGFAEADEEGKGLQSRIDEIINETGVRVLGPNSIGVVNHFLPFSTSFIPTNREESPIAFISQSGGFLEGFSQFKIGKGIDLGNTCDINFSDALTYFEDDAQIRAIGLYVESVRDGNRFLEAAMHAARKKMVLVLKAGRSEEGSKAALSHSGSLAGEDAAFEAAVKQAGLIRIMNVEEFGDISKAFLNLPPLRGNRLGVVTPTGAGGILILDACPSHGFELAFFSEDLMSPLKKYFSPWQKMTNPLDIMSAALAHGYKSVYTQALEVLFGDRQVDAILCVLGEPTLKTVTEVARRYPEKPLVSWVIGPSSESKRENLSVLSYPSPERALRSLAALREYQAFLSRSPGERELFPVDQRKVEKILRTAKKENKRTLNIEAFSILSAYGIPVAPFRTVKTKRQALTAASALKYPVALKIWSAEISHKTEVGGVRIGIRNPRELKLHYEDMMTTVPHNSLDIKIQGMMVQAMVIDGKELILGIKKDPQFGAVIIFGWGGIYTEVLKDFSCAIPPLTSEDAQRMISSTQVSKLLQGARGEPPSDCSFLIECLLRLSQLATEFPEIVELDINPLKLFSTGGMAVDSRVVIS